MHLQHPTQDSEITGRSFDALISQQHRLVFLYVPKEMQLKGHSREHFSQPLHFFVSTLNSRNTAIC